MERLPRRVRADGDEMTKAANRNPYAPPEARVVDAPRVQSRPMPFIARIWVGCGNVHTGEPQGTTGLEAQIAWTCFVVAEPSLWGRLFQRGDLTDAVRALTAEVNAILSDEAAIELIPEP
jgi:hypothetical protein